MIIIYYTSATAYLFENHSKCSDLVHTFLARYQTDYEAQGIDFQATGTKRQIEQYDSKEVEHFKIHWVGFRIKDSDRLISAVVTDKTTGAHYFFALELVLEHDYRKTTVDNPQRLANWQNYMLDYLRTYSPSAILETPATASIPTQRLLEHKGRYIVTDLTQEALMCLPIHQGVLCFGPPGAGKTLIGLQRALDYMHHDLTTVLLFPTQLLADDMLKEFTNPNIETTAKGIQCWSLATYLAQMQPQYPHLNLVYNPGDPREYINEAYFEHWYNTIGSKGKALRSTGKASSKKEKTILDLEPMTLWQEFCYVLMQPNWMNPASAYLTKVEYCALGVSQSNINQSLRDPLYEMVFSPFITHINDPRKFYFPEYVAYQLYLALVTTPPPPESQFDALVLDEVQKFHPWQWACLLKLLREPLSAGKFFICGDAYQGAESQPLRVSESLRLYFATEGVVVPVHHLSVNHRSSRAVYRFVRQIHNLELTILGSMERDTHVLHGGIDQHASLGRILAQPYTQTLSRNIAADATAYVVIPNERCRLDAESLWPKHQIVSVFEFAGMSASKVIMYGFTEYFKTALKTIQSLLPEEGILPSWETTPSYTRKSKGLNTEQQPLLRACFQSIYTAASRAINELMIVEAEEPHPLFKKMCEQQTNSSASATNTAVATSEPGIYVQDMEKKSSPEEWFKRAQEDFHQGLKKQATDILLNSDLLGAEQAATYRAILDKISPEKIYTAVQAILFPRETKEVPASAMVDLPLKTTRTAAATKVKSAAPSPDFLTKKWANWIEELCTNLTETNIKTLFTIKKHSLSELLFEHTMQNGCCLFVNIVSTNNAILFYNSIKEQFSEVKKAYTALKTPDTLLQLCWDEVCLSKNPQELQKKIAAVASNATNLCELLKINQGIGLFIRHRAYFSQEKKLKITMHTASSEGYTPFFFLISRHQGQLLFRNNWDYFVAHGLVSAHSMHQAITSEGPNQGLTPFLCFASRPEGLQFLITNWDDFVARGLVSPRSMHQAITGEGPNQGMTPFFCFTSCPEGLQFLLSNWDDFVARGLVSPDSMHQAITGEGPYQGRTPFFCFVSYPESKLFLIAKWADFLARGLVSPRSMHQAVTGEDPNQGVTPFFCIASCHEGQELLLTNWAEFVARGLVSPRSMHQVITGDSLHQGSTSFFCLASNQKGRQLLLPNWGDFVALGLVSPRSMHQMITGNSPYQGATPFFCFTSCPEGQQLLIRNWAYFIAQGLVLPHSMHQEITGNSTHKGRTPFLCLTDNKKSLALLIANWGYFLEKNFFADPIMKKILNSPFGTKIAKIIENISTQFASRESAEQPTPVTASVATMLCNHGLFADSSANEATSGVLPEPKNDM